MLQVFYDYDKPEAARADTFAGQREKKKIRLLN